MTADMEDILNVQRREAQRTVDRSTTWAPGIVDGYDKGTHSVKVKFQPEGNISGWLPLNSIGIGNNFGIHIGPKVGDPVLVHFQDGDREAGIVLGRFFTDKHKPVPVEEGEFLLQHETNTKVYFKKDGSLLVQFENSGTQVLFGTDKSITVQQDTGSELLLDASGNVWVRPKPNGGLIYLGGSPADTNAVYAFVSTVSGASINTKARIG